MKKYKHVRIRMYQRGSRWYLDYCWQGKRQRYPVADTQEEAELAASTIRTAVATGTFEGPDAEESKQQSMTLGELCNAHRELKKGRKPATQSFYAAECRVILKRIPATTKVTKITRRLCQTFDAGLRMEMSDSSASHATQMLRALLDLAVDWKIIPANPAAGIKLAHGPGRERYLTPTEADRILENCQPWLQPIVKTLIYTGARRGDLLGDCYDRQPLQWRDVDLDRKMLAFRGTKEGKPRYVPMCADLYEMLSKLPSRFADRAVFVDDHGKPVTYWKMRNSFKKAVRLVGIPEVRIHDLRHTAASWMVQSGVSLDQVARVLGHHSTAMTQRYAHFQPEHLTGAVEALSGTLGTNLAQPNRPTSATSS